MMAIGAMRAIREHGLDVPRDIAVAGFDDIPTARYISPPLTTVRVDVEALGARAATLLLDRMRATASAPVTEQTADRATHEVLPGTLVVRASCSVPIDSLPEAPLVSPHHHNPTPSARTHPARSAATQETVS